MMPERLYSVGGVYRHNKHGFYECTKVTNEVAMFEAVTSKKDDTRPLKLVFFLDDMNSELNEPVQLATYVKDLEIFVADFADETVRLQKYLERMRGYLPK